MNEIHHDRSKSPVPSFSIGGTSFCSVFKSFRVECTITPTEDKFKYVHAVLWLQLDARDVKQNGVMLDAETETVRKRKLSSRFFFFLIQTTVHTVQYVV